MARWLFREEESEDENSDASSNDSKTPTEQNISNLNNAGSAKIQAACVITRFRGFGGWALQGGRSRKPGSYIKVIFNSIYRASNRAKHLC